MSWFWFEGVHPLDEDVENSPARYGATRLENLLQEGDGVEHYGVMRPCVVIPTADTRRFSAALRSDSSETLERSQTASAISFGLFPSAAESHSN